MSNKQWGRLSLICRTSVGPRLASYRNFALNFWPMGWLGCWVWSAGLHMPNEQRLEANCGPKSIPISTIREYLWSLKIQNNLGRTHWWAYYLPNVMEIEGNNLVMEHEGIDLTYVVDYVEEGYVSAERTGGCLQFWPRCRIWIHGLVPTKHHQ